MKKQLSEVGLETRCKNDANFALQARTIVALVFVPLGALDDGLEALEAIDPELYPVRTWFELNYVGEYQLSEHLVLTSA